MRILVILICALAAARGQGRVVFLSLDGFGYARWNSDPVVRMLPALKEIARAGAMARGVVPAFPSTTANSHAALWTGTYGDGNGITANLLPLVPRAEHTFLERGNGFRADALAAEPVWVTAARQGVTVVAHQVTQAIPFTARNTHPGAVVVNGYQSKQFSPPRVVRAADVRFERCAGPAVPASALPVKFFRFKAGPLTLCGAVIAETAAYDAMHIWEESGRTAVRAATAPAESAPPGGRPLARHMSESLFLPSLGAGVFFRLFSIERDGSDFLLFHSALSELALHDGAAPNVEAAAALVREAGGFSGNSATSLYSNGAFGQRLDQGGDSTAERRYLETVELNVRQYVRHSEWLWIRFQPRLMVDYLNQPDDIDHAWLGKAERFRPFREWGYAAINRRIEGLVTLVGPAGHIVIASDHGMTPVWQDVRVNVALRNAGLQGKAAYLAQAVLLNTTDWKNGTVIPEEKPALVARVEQALSAVKDPQTGQSVFRAFFRPDRDGNRFGIRCEACGDLYFDLAPGYYSTWQDTGEIVSPSAPRGAHGLLPTRPDMLAVLFARGPKVPAGRIWPTLRVIDVAPLVARLLGIGPPRGARGSAPR